jgi:Lon protease-like protein
VEFLRETLDHLGYPYNQPPLRYEDAAWVGYRLAEALPIDLAQKQYLLQINDPIQRLERIMEVVKGMAGE